MFAIPLPPGGSVAVRVTVTTETYQRLLPSVPARDAVVTGVSVSIFTDRFWIDSTTPAMSVAWYCTQCSPRPRVKGELEYVVHEPLSRRYTIAAIPLRLSFAARVTLTFDLYHPLLPWVPEKVAVVVGGTVSTHTLTL